MAFCLVAASRGMHSQDVQSFGVKGDGIALDSPAINQAIESLASSGGGTLRFPAGTYRCASIRLKSNITLDLEQGATILAADRKDGVAYDAAEVNPSDKYQDYGHTHFQNSLIWGEGLSNVAIIGQGRIWGKGLVHDTTKEPTDGNKSISLRDCRNVLIRDVTIQHGGWFAILATGVDHMTIDNLLIDTNRDGMDIDCCRDVHVSNCTVNSPGDDGICLKSTFALGYARATEDVSITNCHVSGFQEGSVLDKTYKGQRIGTGRIKFGTESNGGFRGIAISNCVFDHCCGLALETVDGGLLEDVTISNIVMRDIGNAPIFMRLGRRMRGPAGTPVGSLRRVSLSGFRIYDSHDTSTISGLPGYPIEDVTLSDIRLISTGHGDPKNVGVVPKEDETGYPEPGEFGRSPSHGFFIRHVKNISFRDVDVTTLSEDPRPPFQLTDVDGADFFLLRAQRESQVPVFSQTGVKHLRARFVDSLPPVPKPPEPKQAAPKTNP